MIPRPVALVIVKIAETLKSWTDEPKEHDPVRMKEKGAICIDCHKGIAHELPQ